MLSNRLLDYDSLLSWAALLTVRDTRLGADTCSDAFGLTALGRSVALARHIALLSCYVCMHSRAILLVPLSVLSDK